MTYSYVLTCVVFSLSHLETFVRRVQGDPVDMGMATRINETSISIRRHGYGWLRGRKKLRPF